MNVILIFKYTISQTEDDGCNTETIVENLNIKILSRRNPIVSEYK